MKLEVHERIALLSLLPREGTYEALKTFRRAREMLSFTPEELEFYEMKNAPGPDGKIQAQWSGKKASEAVKDIPVDEYTKNAVVKALAEMEKKGKLTDQFLSVYEKFVIAYK